MSQVDWITKEQLETAKNQAEKILDEFCNYDDGDEKWWREIEIGEEFFDIECFQEERKGTIYCSVYPTIPSECGSFRSTDGQNWLRLFTREES